MIRLILNDGVSQLAAEKARRGCSVCSAHIAIRPGRTGVPLVRLRQSGVRPLFGGETDITFWSAELTLGRATLCTYRYADAPHQDLPVGLTQGVWGRLQA